MNNENREKPLFLKRVVAYLIDMILVSALATAISVVFINNNDYQLRTEQMIDLTRKLSNKEITNEEYTKESNELNYYLAKESVGTTAVMASVTIVYFVVLSYFCHGITLGKYLMKLRVVSANDKELNILNYLLRSLFINLILSNLFSVIFVSLMSKDTFISIYPRVNNILSLFILVTILFITYRNDGRGLHDFMANTKIISTKVKTIKEENEEVKEAKVIDEKKIVKKATNKVTKTSSKKEVKK